jgi:hypothetical protein
MPSFLQSPFLYGAAAIAVPILIHLFFRLRTKRVDLGTIRFLRTVLEENARRRKVMQWLLLALRVAFVGLLAALFARPYWTAPATGGDQGLLVILIDQSASMQLKGDNGRLIDQAVAEARQLIESAGRKTRVEVAFFDHAVHPLGGDGGKQEAAALANQLTVPAATYGATNFGAAIAWARDICVKAPPGEQRLHLFTDLQRSGLDWTEVEPLPTEVHAALHDLGKPVVNNLAVTELRTPRMWVRPQATSSVRASILHGGAFALDEVPVVLELGRVPDRDQATKPDDAPGVITDFARLSERITRRERVKLEPGATVTLDFELPALGEGLWQGRVAVEHQDDLPFDNQRFFAISATPAHQVLVIHGGEGPTTPLSETYFLEKALALSVDGSDFADTPFQPTVLPYGAGAALPSLATFDAVVLANCGSLTAADAQRIAAFVQAGGGLLVFTGDQVTAASAAALDQAGLSVGKIGETRIAVDLPWRLSQWDEKHPVFEPLSDPQHGDLRRLMFAAYTDIAPAADVAVLAKFHTESPAVVERTVGRGIVLWVTTSCGREWSDWCHSRLFLPTVHQLLGYEVGLTAGGRVRSKLVEATSAATTPGVRQFTRFTEVTNVSPRESETERCAQDEFENRFALRFADDDQPTAAMAAIGQVELRQDEFWHWVACALLGVLVLEGFVGNRTTA